MLSRLNVYECSGSSHIHILSRVKLVVYQISGYTSDLLPQKVHLISSELKSGKSRLEMIEPRPFASIISNKLPYALLVCRPITPDFCNKFCKKMLQKQDFIHLTHPILWKLLIFRVFDFQTALTGPSQCPVSPLVYLLISCKFAKFVCYDREYDIDFPSGWSEDRRCGGNT